MVGCVEGIRIAPAVPESWDFLEMDKEFRGKYLHIRVEIPDHRESGCRSMTLNGQELPDNYIPEELLAEKNEIVLIM